VVTQVEHWALQHLLTAQQEGDEQPPYPAVAVQERVNGLELRVSEGADDERVQASVAGQAAGAQG
jgi:hypothetical protein